MKERSGGDIGSSEDVYSPEQSNLIDYASRLLEGQPLIYQNYKYKEVSTNAHEKLRRFVTGVGRFARPMEYMRYVRIKVVPSEVQKIYAEDDKEYTRILTVAYATDNNGVPTENLTGLTFTKELSGQYLRGAPSEGSSWRDPPLIVDLLDSHLFTQDEAMRQASGLADATAFVNSRLAARINVRKATN